MSHVGKVVDLEVIKWNEADSGKPSIFFSHMELYIFYVFLYMLAYINICVYVCIWHESQRKCILEEGRKDKSASAKAGNQECTLSKYMIDLRKYSCITSLLHDYVKAYITRD